MDIVISEFKGEIQQRILERMNKEYLSTGKFFNDQMSVSPKIMSSLMLSGGVAGTVASAAMSSSLFISTAADPSNLMRIKQGYSTAVMGPQGILTHAPLKIDTPNIYLHKEADSMKTTANSWGMALGIRLTNPVLEKLSIDDKTLLELDVNKDRIIIIHAKFSLMSRWKNYLMALTVNMK